MRNSGRWQIEYLPGQDFYLSELNDNGFEINRTGPHPLRLRDRASSELHDGVPIETVRERLMPRQAPPRPEGTVPRAATVAPRYPAGNAHGDLVTLFGAGVQVPQWFRDIWLGDTSHPAFKESE